MNEQNNCKSWMHLEPGCTRGNCLKIALAILVIFIVVKACMGGRYMKSSSVQKDTIVVSGKGEVTAKPDIATVSFGIVEESMDVSKASDALNTKMAKLIENLKANGIDEKDIKTTDYSIYPRYDYVNSASYPYGGKQVLAGYNVSQNVSLKIRDLSKAGKVVSDLGTLGVTNMSGLNFTNDKYDDLVKDARDQAITEARMEAKKLAKSLGVRLVKIVGYSEGGYTPYPTYARAEAAYGMGGDSMKSAVLPTGENKITSNVSITYEIR